MQRFALMAILMASVMEVVSAAAQDGAPCVPDPSSQEKPILKSVEATHGLPVPPIAMIQDAMSRKTEWSMEMDVQVLADGTVAEVGIINSSGLHALDSYVSSEIKRHWRWEPPISRATCSATDTHTSVKWNFARH